MNKNSLILCAFCAMLVTCVALGFPAALPLGVGCVLFVTVGLVQGHSLQELLRAAWKGIRQVRSIVTMLLLIGVLTALFRSAGTIPCLISFLVPILQPAVLPLTAFLVCAVVSMLTGSAFGTAATAGVLCVTAAQTAGANAIIIGGAALSGSYFGDRSSPISTSALLVALLTKTKIERNIVPMLKSALVPTTACLAIFAVMGAALAPQDAIDITLPWDGRLDLGPVTLLPALSIIVLACFHVDVRVNVSLSCVIAFAITVCVQGNGMGETALYALMGYAPVDPSLEILRGGGLFSMLGALAVVLIAPTYPGLFEITGITGGANAFIRRLDDAFGADATTVLVSIVTSCLACNQTLSIMLTCESVRELHADGRALMLSLENTAAVDAALVPWSVAAAVPLAAMGAEATCLLAAPLLYLLPLWHMAAPLPVRRWELR